MDRATPQINAVLDEALRLAGLGIAVISLHNPVADGCSCCDPTCKQVGKHPRTKHGSKDASKVAKQIREWWKYWSDANLAIATGKAHGLFMVGPDGQAGLDALAQLERQYSPLPKTWRARSGSMTGAHYFFRYPADGKRIQNHTNHLDLPIDVRGDGGLAVVAPSLHKSGNRYEWLPDCAPWECELAEPPDWLVEWCRKKKPPRAAAKAGQSAASASATNGRSEVFDNLAVTSGRPEAYERAKKNLAKCDPAISGKGGHKALMWAARVVRWGYPLSRSEALELLKSDYNPRCKPPWSDADLEHKVDEANEQGDFRYPRNWLYDQDRQQATNNHASNGKPPGAATGDATTAAEDPTIHRTDLGNATRLAKDHGRDLRHVHPWRKWLVWDARRWRIDASATVTLLLKQTILRLFAWTESRIGRLREQMEKETNNGD